ncbi:LPS export ABC transporter periplasmic protein LptC [Starkeya sp. ORNL1]|uniref:LPS export ABC transporter periplasmic protein LptC n=1 Tax=Starkeya sp. ORNL1 TaxID=2709380 RepID=UPI001FEFCBDE|nr:LPS export ABC transporter periplasmic protein LptC [Starkeya sp. ORNL1]
MNRHVPPSETVVGARPAGGAVRPPERGSAQAEAHFKAARRHTRRVRFFRVMLPLGVLVSLAVAAGFALFDPLKIAMDLPFDLGRVSLSGSRIKMELPKLSGFTNDNRGYSVTAKSATQDLTHPDQIDLEEIEARLELAEQGWAKLTAQAGHYNTKSESMMLDQGIRFDTSAGYGGTLQEVKVDVKAGKLLSEQPVELRYLDGKLTADRMEVSQKDSRALLTGNVRLVFKMPPPDTDKAKATPKPATPTSPAPAVP